MLGLTRRSGETIILETPEGDQVQITVLGVKGNHVRIGTEEPADVNIVREELLQENCGSG